MDEAAVRALRVLEAVIDPASRPRCGSPDANPRAQAFYRKHGFAADGTARFDDGVREIRVVRACSATGPAAPTGDSGRRNGLMACMTLPWVL